MLSVVFVRSPEWFLGVFCPAHHSHRPETHPAWSLEQPGSWDPWVLWVFEAMLRRLGMHPTNAAGNPPKNETQIHSLEVLRYLSF